MPKAAAESCEKVVEDEPTRCSADAAPHGHFSVDGGMGREHAMVESKLVPCEV
jgi:hypothetical protein